MWIERTSTFWHSYDKNVITLLETWWKSRNSSFGHSSNVLLWVCCGWEQKHRDSAFDFWRYRTSLVLLRHSSWFCCIRKGICGQLFYWSKGKYWQKVSYLSFHMFSEKVIIFSFVCLRLCEYLIETAELSLREKCLFSNLLANSEAKWRKCWSVPQVEMQRAMRWGERIRETHADC